MAENGYQPFDYREMVLQDEADYQREERRKKGKRYLKYAVCSLFGSSVLFLAKSILGGLFLLSLFILCILLQE